MTNRSIHVRSVEQLRDLQNKAAFDPLKTSFEDKPALKKVIDRFPVRVTDHLLNAMRQEPAVARQFLPDSREVTSLDGETHCFSGLLHTGLAGVERMYADRCIIMPQPTCPAYCRYCFRKFYEHSDGKAMTYPELEAALAYVAREPLLKEVLITGGEPIMDKQRLRFLLHGLRSIEQIATIRIACRSLVMQPSLIDNDLIALLVAHQNLRMGKPIEIALHCNHAAEISDDTIDRIAALRERGIHVYNQTVLLRDVNLDPEVMISLLRKLRCYGVETYHLYFAGPVQGMDHVRPTLDEAIELKTSIRNQCSGRLNPHLIVTTRLGKVELGVDGWIVEREAG